ncbi:MAG: S9 family peptidase [Pseudomonadota bacterium]
MVRIIIILLSISSNTLPVFANQAKPELPVSLIRLPSVRNVAIAPDGNWVAYQRSGGADDRGLWMRNLTSGTVTRVDPAGGDPVPSPDSRQLAYRTDETILVYSLSTSKSRKVATWRDSNQLLPDRGAALTWSPDSKRIAYVSAVDMPGAAKITDTPMVLTRYRFRPNEQGGAGKFSDFRRFHIFIADVANGDPRQLTKGDVNNHSIDWSPDGKSILFISNRERNADRVFNNEIFTIDADSGEETRLTYTEGVEYKPRWSPDGQRIAYVASRRGLRSSETAMEDPHLWVMNADGSEPREIGSSLDLRQFNPKWRDDSTVVVNTYRRGSNRLYAIGLDSQVSELTSVDGLFRSFSIAKSGEIAAAYRGSKDVAQLANIKGPKQIELLTSSDTAEAQRLFGTVTSFTFKSLDGLEVEAFLTLPRDLGGQAEHPLLVDIHGGPHWFDGPFYDAFNQIFASRGWATLQVNYRGSMGYGQSFADGTFRDQNSKEAQDILYGLRAALTRYPQLDAARVGVQGVSYGGQLSMWLVTQSREFCSAVPIAGISNLVTAHYLAAFQDYLPSEYGIYPHQEDMLDKLWFHSPLRYVGRVATPTMLVHGEDDSTVHIGDSEQFYVALQDLGVETQLVRYPGEGHGLRSVENRIDVIRRMIAWHDRHFKVCVQRSK